jgi:GNAT superfamily N-acetyltransferase
MSPHQETASLWSPSTSSWKSSPQDLEFLEDQSNAYNMAQTGAYDGRSLVIFVRNTLHEIVAGVSGYTWAGFCEIQLLWVREDLRGRGYGTQLLRAAEQTSLARGCSLIILGTYSFQAPAFYQKLGYEVVGRIDDCPRHHTNYYLKSSSDDKER